MLTTAASWAIVVCSWAQELNAKVTINYQQIQRTETSVFEQLQTSLNEWLNSQQWTALQFKEQERISCSFYVTVKQYDAEQGKWTCTCLVQANRPVYNSAYTSTMYQMQDNDFSFTYMAYDKIEYNEDIIDNQLTALFAYYAYLIIGIDLDTFSPMGGTDVLQRCMNLTNSAQNISGAAGWEAFSDSRNRFAIINDYTDGAFEPFRQLQYDYYRLGLDEMENSQERGRKAISDAIEQRLQKARKDRPSSLLPQIWTDYKKDELANIYQGKGTAKEKEAVYTTLFNINPSQSNTWDKIKQ